MCLVSSWARSICCNKGTWTLAVAAGGQGMSRIHLQRTLHREVWNWQNLIIEPWKVAAKQASVLLLGDFVKFISWFSAFTWATCILEPRNEVGVFPLNLVEKENLCWKWTLKSNFFFFSWETLRLAIIQTTQLWTLHKEYFSFKYNQLKGSSIWLLASRIYY